jgi:hypothetical protein
MPKTAGPARTPDALGSGGQPPSPNLLKRIARLDSRYEIKLESVWGTGPAPSLRWRVTMRERSQPTEPPVIEVVKDSAVDALAQALDEAEARNRKPSS